MDRAAKILARMRIPGGPSREELIRRIWPAVVGKVVARHTQVVAITGERVLVEVEDEAWRRQLAPLEGQILKKLRQALGKEGISRIVFCSGPPRRSPGQAAAARPADEAEGIPDPVLQRLYLRQRARSAR